MDHGAASFRRRALRWLTDPLQDPAVWRATVYHLVDGVVAVTLFWALGGLLAAAIVLTPVALIGVVLLAGILHAARWVARIERRRARLLLDVRLAEPPPPAAAASAFDWLGTALRDVVAWRSLAYLIVRVPLGFAASAATVLAWFLGPWLITSPIWLSRAGGGDLVDVWWEYVLTVVAGVVVLVVAPHLVRLFAALSRWVVLRLLGPGAGARIRELEGQRSTAVRVADVDRRRIEQDLHDGAQVRLTALALQLGLTREAIAHGADRSRIAALVDEAHAQAKQAVREVRDLARGIHPAILTDRGIEAALESMVGRLPVPVDLDVAVPERPSPAVESIVYFVAAEAVTNAVRHADSAEVGVRVVRDGDEMVVEVRDRGRGGADPDRGTGLASLCERVEASGGHLTVQSPTGVGTLVRAVVPCGS